MKKLLIITSRYPHPYDSISCIFVHSQVEELKKHFEKVVVISTTPWVPKILTGMMKPKRKRDAYAKDYRYDNIEVYFTKNIVMPFEKSKRKRAEKGYKSTLNILKNTKFQPDIIHAHYLWPPGYLAMKLKEDYAIPYIITAHGIDVYDIPFRAKYYKDIIKNIIHNANRIITVSKKNKEILNIKLNTPAEKITIIPNGYDPKFFYPMNKKEIREKLSLPTNKTIILSVGNLKKIKGHINLVNAAKKVVNEKKDILFSIVGDGPERKNLETDIKKYNLFDNFMLVGAKPHNEIPLWINACDIFVIPSLNEGVPTVLFEALASGKPIVGTAVGGIPDIINEERLGFVVPPSNSEALSSAIQDALNKNWDNTHIAKTATKFSWDKIASQIMITYDDLLKKPKSIINKRDNTERGYLQ